MEMEKQEVEMEKQEVDGWMDGSDYECAHQMGLFDIPILSSLVKYYQFQG